MDEIETRLDVVFGAGTYPKSLVGDLHDLGFMLRRLLTHYDRALSTKSSREAQYVSRGLVSILADGQYLSDVLADALPVLESEFRLEEE